MKNVIFVNKLILCGHKDFGCNGTDTIKIGIYYGHVYPVSSENCYIEGTFPCNRIIPLSADIF